MGVFQSWLDCFSIGVLKFIQNINFSSSVVFVHCCPFVTVFQCCNLQFHYTFFQKQQTASDVVTILYNKLYTSAGEKKDSFGTTFYKKNILPQFFLI